MKRHRCAAPGCRVQVQASKLACRRHWYQLPAELRRQIWDAWNAGDRTEHRRLLVEAVRTWGEKERASA